MRISFFLLYRVHDLESFCETQAPDCAFFYKSAILLTKSQIILQSCKKNNPNQTFARSVFQK